MPWVSRACRGNRSDPTDPTDPTDTSPHGAGAIPGRWGLCFHCMTALASRISPPPMSIWTVRVSLGYACPMNPARMAGRKSA
jgi:hypothetical protein